MSAKQCGSFATLLLSIPLSAIPLMAIFGVPDLTNLSASTEELIPDIVRQPTAAHASAEVDAVDSAQSYRSRAADLLNSTAGSAPAASAPADAPQWDTQAGIAATTEDLPGRVAEAPTAEPRHQPSPRPMQTAAVQPAATTDCGEVSTPEAGATASGLTWREAARRLEEVGITDFRLERGQSSDRFLFFCRFSPGGDARIIQRFEAEAAEPLAAVEDVLTQVEAWLQHRYAQSQLWVQ